MSKKTTFICIGDPHFKVSNIKDVELFIDKLIILIKETKPDIIVMLGDLLDTHEKIHSIALNKAYEFIDKLRQIAKTYCLVGNHDMYDNQVFLENKHWMNGMKEWENVVIVDKPEIEEINNQKFMFCPYVYPGRFKEALETCHQKWCEMDCIFAHQEFLGCKMGAFESVDGDKWEKTYPFIVSGHIHLNQKLQNNIYYPGSSMQHAFGESDKNVIPILSFSNDNKYPDINEINLKLPRKKIVYKDIVDIDDYDIVETSDTIKLSISGVYEQFKSFRKTKKYKDLVKKGVKIIFKPNRCIIKKQNEEQKIDTDDTSFSNILSLLVNNNKDPYLFKMYELVINNKDISTNDIIFIT